MSTLTKGQAPARLQDSVVAEMIRAVDTPDYPRAAIRALNRLVPTDAAAMFVYSGDSVVHVIDDDLCHLVDSSFVASYRAVTYQFNPFFQHHRSGLISGIYTMGQLAKAQTLRRPRPGGAGLEIDDSEEIGYRTNGFPKRCSELAIAVRISPTQTIQIALYRSGRHGFYPSEMSSLKGLSETLSALYCRYWQQNKLNATQADSRILTALCGLPGYNLSIREQEVILLDLSGADASQIAGALGISETTIKTHRKRAFEKLGIRTKNELFVILLRNLSR